MSKQTAEFKKSASDTKTPAGKLNLLPPAERELLINTWNATQCDYPSYLCIHQLFEAQVARTPDAPALVHEDQTLSYAQLNARANHLAHRLIQLGVVPDARVAICVTRSPAMVVGLLAILKAGGAYVPLDPAYPSERLVYILADAAPTIVLADETGHAALGQAALACRTVLDPNELPPRADANPQVPSLTARHLAYVIYTSGSTGTPKGVMVEHRNVTNFLTAMSASIGIASHDRLLAVTSIAFDIAGLELYLPMSQGAMIVMASRDEVADPVKLQNQIIAQKISLMQAVPSVWRTLLDLPGPTLDLKALCGGEALSSRLSTQLRLATWGVWNLYGPTETTIWSSIYRISKHRDTNGVTAPIGRPIANTRVYLLDAYGQPVPLGAAGELYIGGDGVARGYLNRPELTAERFVPDPFSDVPDARMYKTGDLARYLPDGNLEFLGRNDYQVKIRGFRIEPGEIEACLLAHPQVRDTVVLARGEDHNTRLIAYTIADPDDSLASTLRAHAAAHLPEYMVPSAFVRLDAFPLTPNGKLDRRALPAPDDDALVHQAYEAPKGELETTLAAIWAELLGVERVGRHDSFFALGGHSLLAVRLIERLRHLGLAVSVRAVFDSPTLGALAQCLDTYHKLAVPLNQIAPDTTTLTPDLLPLIDLNQSDIDRIVEHVPGGVPNIQDIYALSPLQDGILFHHLLATDGDPYLLIAQMAFKDRALLDCYLNAVQQVVDRHDILRTAFVWEGLSTPAQVVWRHAPLSITELTLDPANGPITEQLARCFDPRQHRLDLTQAPLLRFVTAQDSNGRWLLLQLLHHLIGDHSTLDVMHTEVQAFVEGRGQTLPPAQPFRNLIAQARLGMSQEAHKRFFTEMLADVDEPTLPFGLTDVLRDGDQVTESHRMLPQALNDRLRAQAKRMGVSLASLCHLAWAQVLARASGNEQIVFGTVLFGRMQAGNSSDSAMGLFINTLPLRVDLNGGVKDSVRSTHACLAALLEHEHASLVLAQRCSGVPTGAPLFSALLNYRHNTMPSGELSLHADIELLSTQERTNYPMALAIDDFGQALGLTVQVVQPLDPNRLCGYMQQALDSLVKALEHTPSRPTWSLGVLPDDERELLLQTWNATKAPYPQHQCIHQLFEAQVARTPDAIALVHEDQTLSYAQLNARANRLAHQLIQLGVVPDARVAICVARSPAMVVGLLAILKAGGAYVPLDPAYPCERLAYILADAAPAIVLADETGHAALGQAALACCTVLDPNVLPSRADANPQVPSLTARHLAYVIYTSGSTGTPKGVMVEHRNLTNLCVWHRHTFDLQSGHCSATTAGVAFDASVWELWPSLVCGGIVSIPPRAACKDVQALLQWLRQQHLETTFLVTPLAAMALADQQTPAGLRHLLTGGDRFPYLTRVLPDELKLVNNYGPTEATVVATSGQLSGQDKYPHIGRPIANTRVYLLDAYGQPVPLGAAGELHIGGDGVARGYLNRPELTAERFAPDPFSDVPDARMYKTGDLARYLPDGNLEFLGRNDYQVKIRGFRIEPGEIEACLLAHPQVRDTVVLARGEDHNTRLIAYTIADPDDSLASTLRAHAAAHLPEYMVPSAFVRLDAFPLTPNGKLDRRALPAPDDDALVHQAYEAPQGELETTLAAIWAELLGVERVGRHDSFFALGGHSLLAVRLINRVTTLGANVPLATLFASPTLAAFTAAIRKPFNQEQPALPAITPVPHDNHLPLSFAQQRLWFLAQLEDVSDTYHIPMALSLRGRLDKVAWQQALNALFARHEALRSTFVAVDGQPQVQLLPADKGVPLCWHDLRGIPNADAQLAQLSSDEVHASFDLTQGPLVRARMIQLADDEYRFLLTQHHIVSDGWSLGVLVRELSTLYATACAGQPNPLPPLAIQYPDYAAWQRQWLSGERLQHQSDYWRTTLAEAPVLLELPTDRPRPAQQSFAGAHVPVRIDAPTTRALKRLSREHDTTLFMTVLAAWSAVLSRLSGQHDLVIGTPSANRNHQAIEPLIGFFVNMLALRIDLSDEPDIAQLLQRVQRSTLAAQAHQELPFEKVVEIVQPPRRLNHTPLFQVVFSWQNKELSEWHLPNINVVPVTPRYDVVKFDLELNLQEEDDEIIGNLSYATALFDPLTIERHVGYLQVMLRAMVTDTRQPIVSVDILAPAERELLLQTWNATEAPYPQHQCIHQLFEAQVARTPDAIALVHEDQTLSYAQLNARANRLAHQLIQLGVVPDARVAICVARSPAMVVGLLAILKAGGAYVPLDPAYPCERLAYILADAAPAIVLADETGHAALGQAALACCTVLDPNVLPSRADANPQVPSLTARHLAYVIYTSGSTGTPKGVQNEHRALINRLTWMQQAYGLTPDDRVLQKTSFSFDVSVWEFFWTLLNGATLVMAAPDTHKDPSALSDIIRQQYITTAHFVPSMLSTFLHSACIRRCTSVKRLICSGEALPAASVRLCQTLLPHAQLYNLYGPTEAAIDVTAWTCPIKYTGESVPIGRPIANTRVYLLDAYGQPVPLGAAGELHIGGDGVARGYLNRPELTAERFAPDPFSDVPDARMYKTGDLARYLPDGNLEFLGRNDYQVKIRGFRIEPGEIEACLLAHPQVRDTVVLARGEDHNTRLIAYTIADPDDSLASTLRAHAAAHLPEYMVPSAFVRLDAFPLTPNGKLDRRALPAPDDDALVHQAYEAPQGELETTLAAIWAELLGVERVGRHDSFFALGGHSLLAVRLISRIRAILGIELNIRALLEAPTVAGLVHRSLQLDGTEDDSFDVLLPIKSTGNRPPLFCIHPVGGLSWHYRSLVNHLNTDQPVYGLQARGLNDLQPTAASIEAMASDYIKQIQRIQPSGPYHLLGWSFGGNVVHNMATQLEQQGEKIALLVLLDSYPDHTNHAQQNDEPNRDLYINYITLYGDNNFPEVEEYLWKKIQNVVKNNNKIIKNFSPSVYCGDMLFFRATIVESEAVPLISSDVWQPYVLGNIETYDIHCKHSDMSHPTPTAEIGQILSQKLDKLSNSDVVS
nr:non-ribosomal peptide synthetase [Mycetohabitans endofungorum]